MSDAAGSKVLFAGSADAKKPRTEEKQTILPVTCRSIQAAVASRTGDAEVQFYGVEPGMLVLVGMVESMSQQAACMEIALNDSTGRIRIKQYLTDGSAQQLEGVEAGSYIIVAGQLRTSPEVHISAMNARRVRSPDEVSYHMIEAAHAVLKLQQGPTTAVSAAPEGIDAAAIPTPMKADVPMPTVPVGLQSLSGKALSEAVVSFIKQEAVIAAVEGKPEGINVVAICDKFKGTLQAEVRASLQQLVDDGEAYTTFDDDHYAML